MRSRTTAAALPTSSERLHSLDALRGFSMFWLLGGAALIRLIFKEAPEGSWTWQLTQQFQHVAWEGFRFYDFIFPLFLFCIGVAIPLSVEKRLAQGFTRGQIFRQALVRTWWMIFFGWWVNGNLLSWDPSKFALSYSVLMMLGLGFLMATSLVLFTKTKTQVSITLAVLLGYWALQMGFPVPGRVPGTFEADLIFSDWLYNQTIGQLGAPWRGVYGKGFPISVWNHGATAMLGVFASRILYQQIPAQKRVLYLVLGGVALMFVGWLWSFHLPIVKNRWTSSYVLWCGGLSWLLLAAFYAIIDLLKCQRWAALFLALGANSILAYLISTVFMGPFRSVASTLFGGLSHAVSPQTHSVILMLASYGLAWSFLLWMHRQKYYLKL